MNLAVFVHHSVLGVAMHPSRAHGMGHPRPPWPGGFAQFYPRLNSPQTGSSQVFRKNPLSAADAVDLDPTPLPMDLCPADPKLIAVCGYTREFDQWAGQARDERLAEEQRVAEFERQMAEQDLHLPRIEDEWAVKEASGDPLALERRRNRGPIPADIVKLMTN